MPAVRAEAKTTGRPPHGAYGRFQMAAPSIMLMGEPSCESDRALADAFARILERKYPGRRIEVERAKASTPAESAAGETFGRGPDRVHGEDEPISIAA